MTVPCGTPDVTGAEWDEEPFTTTRCLRSTTPQSNRDLNQDALHFGSKFGDPNFNGWRVMARSNSGLTHEHTHGHTQRLSRTMTIPEGQKLSYFTGGELRSSVKCIVVTFVKGSFWLLWRYPGEPKTNAQYVAIISRQYLCDTDKYPAIYQ